MTPSGAVQQVAVHGFTWTSLLVAVLNVLVGGALVAWVKSRPKMLELQKKADEQLQANLIKRVESLEAGRERDRVLFDEERVRHEAEISIMRHRMNNVVQCLDALFMLIEASPEKASEHVQKVRAMRARQEQVEATEKAALHSAKIVAAATKPIPPEIDI